MLINFRKYFARRYFSNVFYSILFLSFVLLSGQAKAQTAIIFGYIAAVSGDTTAWELNPGHIIEVRLRGLQRLRAQLQNPEPLADDSPEITNPQPNTLYFHNQAIDEPAHWRGTVTPIAHNIHIAGSSAEDVWIRPFRYQPDLYFNDQVIRDRQPLAFPNFRAICDGTNRSRQIEPQRNLNGDLGYFGYYILYQCWKAPDESKRNSTDQEELHKICTDRAGTYSEKGNIGTCSVMHGANRILFKKACDESTERNDGFCLAVVTPKLHEWYKTQVKFAYLYAEDRNIPVPATGDVGLFPKGYTRDMWNNPQVDFNIETSHPIGNSRRTFKIRTPWEIDDVAYKAGDLAKRFTSDDDPLQSVINVGSRHFKVSLTRIATNFLANGDIDILHRLVKAPGEYTYFPGGATFEPTCDGKHQIHVSRAAKVSAAGPDLGAFRLMYMCYPEESRQPESPKLLAAFQKNCVGPSALYDGMGTCSLDQPANRSIIWEACGADRSHIICKNILQPADMQWKADKSYLDAQPWTIRMDVDSRLIAKRKISGLVNIPIPANGKKDDGLIIRFSTLAGSSIEKPFTIGNEQSYEFSGFTVGDKNYKLVLQATVYDATRTYTIKASLVPL